MNVRPRSSRILLLAIVAAAALAVPVTAQTRRSPRIASDVPLVPVLGVAKEKLLLNVNARRGTRTFSPAHHECPGDTPHVQGISCGSTTTDQLTSAGSCVLDDGSLADFYSFAGTAGQPVTITLTSSALDAFVFLLRPDFQTVAYDDDSAGGTNSRIVFTLDTPGNWIIAVNSFNPNEVGEYSLIVQCGSAPPLSGCTPGSTTLCLNNGRFRVTMTFLTRQVQTGAGQALVETSDTGLMWFFSANNIEVIIKVVNGCVVNQRYWVFIGGLTDVQVAITVVDTQTGAIRSYWNPQGEAFLPIQDTDAFATCP